MLTTKLQLLHLTPGDVFLHLLGEALPPHPQPLPFPSAFHPCFDLTPLPTVPILVTSQPEKPASPTSLPRRTKAVRTRR